MSMFEGVQTRRSMIQRHENHSQIVHGVFGAWYRVLRGFLFSQKPIGRKVCPTPQKQRYCDMETAQRIGKMISMKDGGCKMSAYRCPCGSVHLSSNGRKYTKTK